MIQTQTYRSPLGELIIGVFEEQLVLMDWKYRKMRSLVDNRLCVGLGVEFMDSLDPLHTEAIGQLDSYFKRELIHFDLPIRFVGSDFQIAVWNRLLKIPFGRSKSYIELSRDLGNEKAIRAVALANGANALSIIVPCHRIIGKDGSLTGYAGGLKAKESLLKIEGIYPGNQLTLFE